jgi:hypothetical protein
VDEMLRKSLVYCLFVSAISFFTINPMLLAYEPNIESPKKALESGQVAFAGRIVRIDEVQRDAAEIIGEAHIQVHNCYYGLDCRTVKLIKMRYIVDTVAERSFPVHFNVSDEILVVLKKQVSSNSCLFHSDLESGLDAAFIIGDTFPENFYKNSKMRLTNIYRNKLIHHEEKENINKWAKERAVRLNRK